jgi:major vault protein
LSEEVEKLLAHNASGKGFAPCKINEKGEQYYEYSIPAGYNREKTKAVLFKAPHNSAVQIFDYREKQSRIIFGPELIMLEPYEELTVVTLSGGAPKVEG